MGSPAGIHQTMTSSSERSGDDRKERRQEHIEQLRERRQEHIEQLRERREDRADSSTTRTGTHIKN
jgi:membrane protein involved in colicin uptake